MIRLALAAAVLLAACGGSNPDYLPTEELMKPEACMECHPKHFTEWSGSMHAYAADDPVFLAMNARGQADTGGALGDFCVNCHAPMAVRLGMTTDGLNLSSLPQHVKGVTCFFCHSVASVEGDHNNPLVLAADDTMRGGLRDPGPVDSPAHRSMYSPYVDADAPESAAMCGACHDFQNSKGVHLERTFEEWKTTIFGQLDRPMSFLTCGECHMDPYTDVVADVPDIDVPQRQDGRRDHSFPGIDVALTPWPQQAEQLAAIEKFLKPTLNPKLCYNPENELQYTLDNVGSGHMFPSGAAQDRRAWAEVIVYDASDNVLYSSGVVAPGVDPDPAEPDLFRFWDDIFDDAGEPTHFFWEVASHDESTLLKPATTTCPSTPGFFHATIHDYPVTLNFANVARITARVLIRPMPFELLEELGIDPAIQGMMPTHEVTGTKVEWTPATEPDGYCVTLPRGGIPTPICP
jgi:hypothetical protein